MAGALESIKLPFTVLQQSENIDAELTREQSAAVGYRVKDGYDTDRQSRREWEKQYQNAQKLALQVSEKKTWPWENAANIKFPLLTVATLQFSARAYSAMLKGPDIVRCKVVGADPMGAKRSRATRVAAHMSYQMLEECEPWEEEHDRLLMTVPIIGCSFIKTYYDPATEKNYGEHVLANDLVVNYHARSLETAERKTHRFYLYPREIRERQLAGLYSPVELTGSTLPEERPEDQRQGTAPPPADINSPREFLEQHCFFDFDGDGYPEPYIVTIDRETAKVMRIVNRFGEVTSEQSVQAEKIAKIGMALAEQAMNPAEAGRIIESAQSQAAMLMQEEPSILKIEPVEYFTKFSFIPASDGGFYDLGFGALLGPINESVNSIINQLVDSGTLQNMQGGFIGKGANIKGGSIRFTPGEWKRVAVAGATLRESIVPVPVGTPSPVLFQLLGLLIQYGERIASVTEAMTGENVGQNTPAYNMQSMLTQGMAVFSGIFKRLYRSFRDEYRKWYMLNAKYLKDDRYFQIMDGPDRQVLASDYRGDPTDIRPAADPNAALAEEKLRQAMLLAQRSGTVPGYDMTQVELRILEASGIGDVQEVFPTAPDPQTGKIVAVIPPPQNPEIEMKREEERRRVLEASSRAKVDAAQVELINAQTIKLITETGAIDQKLGNEKLKMILDATLRAREIDAQDRQDASAGVAG